MNVPPLPGEPIVAGHIHAWAAYALYLGFLQSRCPCGLKWFAGGYADPRKEAIVARLNRSWRVR